MRQIVLDTETTGLATSQGHRIIEIGCLELVNRRLTGREYHRFLNPERAIDEGAERVHGISNADLEGQPRFAEIADELLEFLRNSELVIHNAEFDVGFLEYELTLMNHARAVERIQRFDDGRHFHAIVGGLVFTAMHCLATIAGYQQHSPATGTRITPASPVGEYLNRCGQSGCGKPGLLVLRCRRRPWVACATVF